MNHIYGLAPVLEALRARRRMIQKVLVAESAGQARVNELVATARRNGIRIEKRDRRALDALAPGVNHQGVIAVLASAQKSGGYVGQEAILGALSDTPLLVLLDGIEDPHNLGAILRSCEGAGVDGVFLPEHRAAGLTETVAKTSAGAVEYVRVARITNLVRMIEELQERGVTVVGVEGGGENDYSEFELRVPLAVIFGSEGKGLRRLVREKCDALVSIPMHGHINSLNVSVAAGVVLFEILRQRKSSPPAMSE